jgi:fused signal recognition particle receptor
MFNILKRNKPTDNINSESEPVEKSGFFNRLKNGLAKTRSALTERISQIVLGKKVLDAELLDLIETQLLLADIGVDATQDLIQSLTQQLGRKELVDADKVLQTLQTEMQTLLQPCQIPLNITNDKTPFVILVVGINGSGKTTTIGKLAKLFQQQGKKVMLAAGDTFRAAAIEQLQIWGERNEVPVIAQQPGADTAAVIFDALEAAKARQIDVLIADTAGRLHTQSNLMEELKKINRVLAKIDPSAPHEVLLVLDATTGQNALNQAIQFHKAMGISGIALTKLDGTAKGGMIFNIAKQLQIPIRFIGIGEKIDDLRPFDAEEFTKALFLS